jgi:hypothetical protein
MWAVDFARESIGLLRYCSHVEKDVSITPVARWIIRPRDWFHVKHRNAHL